MRSNCVVESTVRETLSDILTVFASEQPALSSEFVT